MNKRRTVMSEGLRVLQHFDVSSPYGGDYDYSNRPIAFGCELSWQQINGVYRLAPVQDSVGPMSHGVRWPFDSGSSRKFPQHAPLFVAKVTNKSPLKVRAVKRNDGSPDPFVVDTELAEISVVGPKGYSATVGDVGGVYQLTELKEKQLVFVPGSSGGAASAGVGGWYGNGVDGAITFPASLVNTDANGFGVVYSGGTGAWTSGLPNLQGIIAVGLTGAMLDPSGLFPSLIDPVKIYWLVQRTIQATTVEIQSGAVVVPCGYFMLATTSITGPNGEVAIRSDGDIGYAFHGAYSTVAWAGFGYHATPGNRGDYGGMNVGGVNSTGGLGDSAIAQVNWAPPPFDEISSSGLWAGSGGAAPDSMGGTFPTNTGSGQGFIGGHPMYSMPAAYLGQTVNPSEGFYPIGAHQPIGGGAGGPAGVTGYSAALFGARGKGGDGGWGGGTFIARAGAVIGSFGISCNGGTGQKGVDNGTGLCDNGGGAGANGGWAVVAADSIDPGLTFSASPGAGGPGCGAGQAGTGGGATGRIFKTGPAGTTIG